MGRDIVSHTESRNLAFTVVGLLVLLAYASACLPSRPSWSPDGSKLLYSYYDPKAEEAGVALFDRATGTTRSIFTVSDPGDDVGPIFIPAQWEAGGERAILRPGPEGNELLLVPRESSNPEQRFELPTSVEWSPLPVPEIAGSLYFGGKNVSKFDLRTGEVTSRETEKVPHLYDGWGGVYYLAKDKRSVRGHEVGRLNLEDLTLEPLFELESKETHGIGALFRDVAFDSKGDRIALIGDGETGSSILLCSEAGLQETMVPELPLEQYVLENLQWSPDGETLYAAVFSPAKSSGFRIFRADRMLFSVAEIPMGADPPRLIPIARVSGKFDGCVDCSGLQIALSPDGSTLATSTAFLGPSSIKEEDRALYLVDVKDPSRPVTKFPLPFSRNEPVVLESAVHELRLVGGRPVHGGKRDVVQAQIDRKLSAVMDGVVQNETPKRRDARQVEFNMVAVL